MKDIDLNVDDINIGEETIPTIDTVSDDAVNEDSNTTSVIDEDDIKIGDKKAPIVMLFGPPHKR